MDIVRTTNTHPDFLFLTKQLDAELKVRYGALQTQYDALNKIEPLDTALVGYVDAIPMACGCFKRINHQTIEIKRLYVCEAYRRKGFGVLIVDAIEEWGSELGYSDALLETGAKQPESIGLYKRLGYHIIDNYGPYKGLENSLCMAKAIPSH